MYDIYKEQIVLESIGPRIMLIEFYGLNYHQSELLEMKTEFKSDIIDVGITPNGGKLHCYRGGVVREMGRVKRKQESRKCFLLKK